MIIFLVNSIEHLGRKAVHRRQFLQNARLSSSPGHFVVSTILFPASFLRRRIALRIENNDFTEV
jgi:hypothetical protein